MMFLKNVPNVITAAYSLVGEVGYFWGGKSTQIVKTPVGVRPKKYLQQAVPAVELSVHMVLTAVDLLHGQ